MFSVTEIRKNYLLQQQFIGKKSKMCFEEVILHHAIIHKSQDFASKLEQTRIKFLTSK